MHSDGHTPEEQVKQILNIAAILPGQQPTRRFSIPERNYSLDKIPQYDGVQSQSQSQPAPTAETKAPAAAPQQDLIDFSEESLPQHPPTEEPGAGYADIKDAPVIAGMAPTGDLAISAQKMHLNQGPDRVVSPSLQRLDTETHTIEEFHDAEA